MSMMMYAEELANALIEATDAVGVGVYQVRRTRVGYRRWYVADLVSKREPSGVVAAMRMLEDGFGGFTVMGFNWRPRLRTIDASCRPPSQAGVALRVARSLARGDAPVRVLLSDGKPRVTTGGKTVVCPY